MHVAPVWRAHVTLQLTQRAAVFGFGARRAEARTDQYFSSERNMQNARLMHGGTRRRARPREQPLCIKVLNLSIKARGIPGSLILSVSSAAHKIARKASAARSEQLVYGEHSVTGLNARKNTLLLFHACAACACVRCRAAACARDIRIKKTTEYRQTCATRNTRAVPVHVACIPYCI